MIHGYRTESRRRLRRLRGPTHVVAIPISSIVAYRFQWFRADLFPSGHQATDSLVVLNRRVIVHRVDLEGRPGHAEHSDRHCSLISDAFHREPFARRGRCDAYVLELRGRRHMVPSVQAIVRSSTDWRRWFLDRDGGFSRHAACTCRSPLLCRYRGACSSRVERDRVRSISLGWRQPQRSVPVSLYVVVGAHRLRCLIFGGEPMLLAHRSCRQVRSYRCQPGATPRK